MFDWNHNGKIDAEDHALTAFMIDQMENGDKPTGGCGCCASNPDRLLLKILFLPI